MTKDERDALNARILHLDLIQNILQKGTYPGSAAKEILAAQQWIYQQWVEASKSADEEKQRIEALLNGPELPFQETSDMSAALKHEKRVLKKIVKDAQKEIESHA